MKEIQLIYPTKYLKTKYACYKNMRSILEAMKREYERNITKNKEYEQCEENMKDYLNVFLESLHKLKELDQKKKIEENI